MRRTADHTSQRTPETHSLEMNRHLVKNGVSDVSTPRNTSLSSEVVLEHMRPRGRRSHAQHSDSLPYYLMCMILRRQDFDGLESLIEFCECRHNLQPWLPSEGDRIVFSNKLAELLRELLPELSASLNTPVASPQSQ